MTPEEHYAQAEKYATRAASMQGAASDAAIRHAILAVAHALLSISSPFHSNNPAEREKAWQTKIATPILPVPSSENDPSHPESRRWEYPIGFPVPEVPTE